MDPIDQLSNYNGTNSFEWTDYSTPFSNFNIKNRMGRKWHKAKSRWKLTLNLILQPQPNAKLWIEFNQTHRYRSLRVRELRIIPEANKKMEEICNKISSGYCAKYEMESLKIIPIPIKQIIGAGYLFTEPSVFRGYPDPGSDKEEQIHWESEYIVKRCEDGAMLDVNEHPATNSLLLESVPSLSDIGEIVD